MDRSDLYLSMCDSEQLQNLKPHLDPITIWKFQDIDGERTILMDEQGNFVADIPNRSNFIRPIKTIWTPRIDNLVKMLGGYNKVCNIIYWWEETFSIIDQVKGAYWDYESSSFDSFEKLLLAVWMYQTHNLIWKEGRWITTG